MPAVGLCPGNTEHRSPVPPGAQLWALGGGRRQGAGSWELGPHYELEKPARTSQRAQARIALSLAGGGLTDERCPTPASATERALPAGLRPAGCSRCCPPPRGRCGRSEVAHCGSGLSIIQWQ